MPFRKGKGQKTPKKFRCKKFNAKPIVQSSGSWLPLDAKRLPDEQTAFERLEIQTTSQEI